MIGTHQSQHSGSDSTDYVLPATSLLLTEQDVYQKFYESWQSGVILTTHADYNSRHMGVKYTMSTTSIPVLREYYSETRLTRPRITRKLS